MLKAIDTYATILVLYYSMGVGILSIITLVEDRVLKNWVMLVWVAIFLAIRHLLRARYGKTISKYFIEAKSSKLVTVLMAFSLGFYINLLVSPKYYKDAIESWRHLDLEVSVLMFDYVFYTVVGVLLSLFIQILRGKSFGPSDSGRFKQQFFIFLIIGAIATRFIEDQLGFAFFSEDIKIYVGHFLIGSISILIARIFFLSKN